MERNRYLHATAARTNKPGRRPRVLWSCTEEPDGEKREDLLVSLYPGPMLELKSQSPLFNPRFRYPPQSCVTGMYLASEHL